MYGGENANQLDQNHLKTTQFLLKTIDFFSLLANSFENHSSYEKQTNHISTI